jgi:uncharacterized protein
VPDQAEVVTLLGDVAEQDGEAVVHLHAVLGRADGSTVGDPKIGLALIRLPK